MKSNIKLFKRREDALIIRIRYAAMLNSAKSFVYFVFHCGINRARYFNWFSRNDELFKFVNSSVHFSLETIKKRRPAAENEDYYVRLLWRQFHPHLKKLTECFSWPKHRSKWSFLFRPKVGWFKNGLTILGTIFIHRFMVYMFQWWTLGGGGEGGRGAFESLWIFEW